MTDNRLRARKVSFDSTIKSFHLQKEQTLCERASVGYIVEMEMNGILKIAQRRNVAG